MPSLNDAVDALRGAAEGQPNHVRTPILLLALQLEDAAHHEGGPDD